MFGEMNYFHFFALTSSTTQQAMSRIQVEKEERGVLERSSDCATMREKRATVSKHCY